MKIKFFLDGAKIRESDINKKVAEIEKKEFGSLSSAFSMVNDALEKKSKIFKIEGNKKNKENLPEVTLL